MKRRTAILSHVAILFAGVSLGYVWGFESSWRELWSQTADRDTRELANRVNILSHLRLGQTDHAISTLEMPIDEEVVIIAHAGSPDFKLIPDAIPKARLHALQMAKAYREIYPAAPSRIQPSPAVVFEQIPSLTLSSMRADCESGFCTLIKSRSPRNPPQATE